MKYLKLFESRTSSSPYGNKEICYKKKQSRPDDSYYIEMVHIPSDNNSGLYIEYQVDKLTEEKIILKCGLYQREGLVTRYKYKKEAY